jgi:hypothetical protein
MKKLITIFTVLFSAQGYAQSSGQIGHFDLVPQRIYANPAFQPKAKFNIAFPALGNVYAQHGNNWIQPQNFVEGDNSVLSPESILAAIDDEATTSLFAGVELFHAGLRFGNHYVHLRAAERLQTRLNLPVDIFNLAVYGNVGSYQFENNTANFSNLALDAIHFREYAAGFNTQITDKINLGITAKYLYGMEVIKTEKSSLQLRTDPNTYELTSSGQFQVNTSGINSLVSGDGEAPNVEEYLLKKKNSGFAFDLGGTYEVIEGLRLQISAHDIGFIRWKDDIANYQTENAGFAFDGVDLTEFLFQEGADFSDEFQNEVDSLLNELEESFGFEKTSGEFKTSLNGFMRYGAAYEIFEKKGFRGTGWCNVTHGLGESLINFQASLGYNQTLWNAIQAGVHMTKSGDLPFTLGGGLSVNAGFFQIYAMVENFSVAPIAEVTIISEDNPSDRSTVILPASTADLRMHFGINFTFNRDFGSDQGSGRAMMQR